MASWYRSADLKIAFDQQVFLLQAYGGISRYICSLAKELSLLPSMDTKIIAPLHFNENLQQLSDKRLVLGRKAPVIPKTFRLVSAISTQFAHLEMRRFKPDIIHETYFSNEDYCPRNTKRVVTVYDMIHEKFSETLPKSEVTTLAKRAATLRADHVICISHSTRRDLIELFGIPEEKISVVHLACDPIIATESAVNRVAGLSVRPYLLYVGSRGGYKNFSGLLRAYASSNILKREFSIVAFGGGVFDVAEMALMRELGIDADRVHHIGGGDDILASLYKKASVFVYPSLYEGFGIPPLEAMSLGCPVITSNTSSLPEVVGDAGRYFDSNSLESLRVSIEDVVLSESTRADLIERGYKRNSAFSWKRCASETAAIYRSIV